MSQFNEYITFRALQTKYRSGYNSLESLQSLIDSGALTKLDEKGHAVPITSIDEVMGDAIKNLCAKVPAWLVDRLDELTTDLGMSKREFVEIALIEAISKADSIIDEVDIHQFYASHAEPEKAPELEVLK